VLGDYVRRFPKIELIVLAGTTEFLLESLRSQNLDLAIVMPTAAQTGLSVTALGDEELVIVLNREHPLAAKRTLDARDLLAAVADTDGVARAATYFDPRPSREILP
jgi:DNA-binding transcriptional LysR family regulator